jgi:hypothetical protein
VCERGKMRCREVSIPVLDEMEVLDQEITSALAVAEQGLHLRERSRIDLPPFRRFTRPAPHTKSAFARIVNRPSPFE